MAHTVTPADIPLPKYLDHVLSFISDNLPQPVYSILISILSRGLALVATFWTLLRSLMFNSSNWNAQTLLPPLIALLSAYLAILSLYRTMTWMLRTTFWFIKWGTLLASMAAGAGWLLGNGSNAIGGRGVANTAAGFILDIMNNEEQNAARSAQTSSIRKRPKPWNSFKDHRDWQYREKQDEKILHNDAQILMDSIITVTASAIKESGWWGVFNSAGGDKEKEMSDSSSVSR